MRRKKINFNPRADFGLLILVCCVTLSAPAESRVLRVPSDFVSIALAIAQTNSLDTVLIAPGEYPEIVKFPQHDIVLAGSFLLSGDTVSIAETIINANSYADADSSSVLIFATGNSRASRVIGLTLTGGHGTLLSPPDPRKTGGCILALEASPSIEHCRIVANSSDNYCVMIAESGSPSLSQCLISDNCGEIGCILVFGNMVLNDSAIFQRNSIVSNYGCVGNSGLWDNGIACQQARVSVLENRFSDYQGFSMLGLYLYETRAMVRGNVFERLRARSDADIIYSTNYDNEFSDNVFTACSLGTGTCLVLAHNANPENVWRSVVQRNWFESIVHGEQGASALYMQHPNAIVSQNVVIGCPAYAFQLSQTATQGCEAVFERNIFWNCTAPSATTRGSAFLSVGDGPACLMQQNWFEGNRGISLDFQLSPPEITDLTDNYWGHASGPYHPTENPQGQGDTVDVNIHVTPWLAEPPDLEIDVRARLKLNPEDWTLEQIFPNPFNGQTNIRIVARKPQPMSVIVYNTLGQKISDVWQGVIAKDEPTLIRWDGVDNFGRGVASGVYYIVAQPRGSLRGAPKAQKAVLLR
jgi:hypothetical protein